MVKCKCGVELFEGDIVKKDGEWGYCFPVIERKCESDGRGMQDTLHVYRCPKCFKIKKIKFKPKFYE